MLSIYTSEQADLFATDPAVEHGTVCVLVLIMQSIVQGGIEHASDNDHVASLIGRLSSRATTLSQCLYELLLVLVT